MSYAVHYCQYCFLNCHNVANTSPKTSASPFCSSSASILLPSRTTTMASSSSCHGSQVLNLMVSGVPRATTPMDRVSLLDLLAAISHKSRPCFARPPSHNISAMEVVPSSSTDFLLSRESSASPSLQSILNAALRVNAYEAFDFEQSQEEYVNSRNASRPTDFLRQ